jgi:hypothetical protein
MQFPFVSLFPPRTSARLVFNGHPARKSRRDDHPNILLVLYAVVVFFYAGHLEGINDKIRVL